MEASLWTRCMGALETELPEQQFNTWVRPLQAMEGNGALKLLAPNRFVVDWINANLLPRIGELLRDESTGDARRDHPQPEDHRQRGCADDDGEISLEPAALIGTDPPSDGNKAPSVSRRS